MIKKISNSYNGFSLIELVVVIAVLGVLTAIALPNFFGIDHAAKVRSAQNGLIRAFKECKISMASGNTPTFSLEKLRDFTYASADNSVNYLQDIRWINSDGRGICHPSGIRANPDIGGNYPEFIINDGGSQSCISGVPSVSPHWQIGCTGTANTRNGQWN